MRPFWTETVTSREALDRLQAQVLVPWAWSVHARVGEVRGRVYIAFAETVEVRETWLGELVAGVRGAIWGSVYVGYGVEVLPRPLDLVEFSWELA